MPPPRCAGRAAPIAAAAALLLAALPLFPAGTLRAGEFFQVRDQNPLLRGFYLPLPADTRADGGLSLGAALLVSNTLNIENRGSEKLFVDGESAVLDLSLENSLSEDWHYRFTVPVIRDSGGSLDSVIDTWHRAFGFSRGYRPFYPKKHIDYSYSGHGAIDLDHSQTGFGDVSADLGWYALDDARKSLSLWAGIKAPTGSVTDLTSDGAWDGALWAHAAMRWTTWRLAGELGVSQPFGDELFAGAAHRSAAFARFSATRAMGPSWSLRAQIDGQTSRVAGTELRFLGPSLQLSLGAERRLHGRWRIQMGFTEDAAVNTAPDITFFLGIHS